MQAIKTEGDISEDLQEKYKKEQDFGPLSSPNAATAHCSDFAFVFRTSLVY